MAVYRDQVLAIGTDDVDDMLNEPHDFECYGIWGSAHMTEDERAMLQLFTDNFESSDDD